jgi:hypothetical protein
MLFVTLTYEVLPDSFTTALKQMQLFIRRIGKYTDHQCKILYVPELGENNSRLHFHVLLCGRMPSIHLLRTKYWDKGIVDIQRIKNRKKGDCITAVSAYLSKYITKDSAFIPGRKRAYYISDNWQSDVRKAYVPGTTCSQALKKMESLRRITKSPAPSVSTIDIGGHPAKLITYKYKGLDKTALESVLKKNGISFMDWDFMRKTEEMNNQINIQNRIADFCREIRRNQDVSDLQQFLSKNLTIGESEQERKAFCQNVRLLNKWETEIPDLVYFTDRSNFCSFLNNPEKYRCIPEAFYKPDVCIKKTEVNVA